MSAGSRRILAPGKLVLAGEYAVLDGAPALVMAIDRGVSCDVEPGGDGVRIETPDGDDRFVRPALDGAAPGRYRFAAWNPVDLPGKPGFGGSAAACVAACLAAGRPASDAIAIHHRVQGGGSGIDVAASIHGGVLRFQDGVAEPREVRPPVVVYSGASASTGPRVQQYRAWSGPLREHFVYRSTQLVGRFPLDPVGVCAALSALLAAMASAAHIEWRSPGLDRIMTLARDHGGAAKPSGAGGGDVAVAWLPDPDAEAAFLSACATVGLPPIAVSIARGATDAPV